MDQIGGSSFCFLIFLGERLGVVTRPKGDGLRRDGRGPIASVARRAFRSPGVVLPTKSRDRNDYPSDQARKAGPADPIFKISIMETAPTGRQAGGLARDGSHIIEVEAVTRMRHDIESSGLAGGL